MIEASFVDANVLIYRRDSSEPVKQQKATAWIDFLWQSKQGHLSVQVLNEFYVIVTRKLKPGMDIEAARADVRALMMWQPIDTVVVEKAWIIQDRFLFSWWDSLIVAAAQVAQCRYLLTEDLQDGQELDSVIVVNPFIHTPQEIFQVF
ncbi:twitching motility protein PilT [Candidatus Thiomargarita nelsonii]|uniref:Twitching motility protein PilT n=1 Tax=Candidatus Thiomargarita nelsonii TaxID=1003181 RepID=A0A0A6P7T4_9GAMM|nr:twitching motility protein PilT [Candidatus Thiomargarita nelsonii]